MNAHAFHFAASVYNRAVDTIPPVRQVVLLYDAAMRWVREAKRAIAEGRIEDRFHAVRRATAIVEALHQCLDFDRGGEIAELLDRYYTYLHFRLQTINVRNDPLVCDEVLERLAEMRASWAKIAGFGAEAAEPEPAGAALHG